jgi:hypothetical protein
LVVAFAISVAIHEVLAGFVQPANLAETPREPERVQRISLMRIKPKPTPSPRPTPKPRETPIAIARTHIIAARAAPRRAIHRAGAAPAVTLALTTTATTASSAAPAALEAAAAPGTGGGTGAGNASGPGSLGDGTAGTGSGGTEPCGAVTLSNPHGSNYDPSTGGFHVDIRLAVNFPDGHRESLILDYPFYYPNEAASPWADRNLHNANVPTMMQAPPPDRAATEPPLVQYVLQHTRDGFTLLRDCPAATPSP